MKTRSATRQEAVSDMTKSNAAKQELPGFTARHRLLFVCTYLCYIAVNTAPNALMPATKAALGLTSGDVAFIGSWQTIGLAFGKCVWGGWPADLFGARRTYMWTMLALAAAVLYRGHAGNKASIGADAGTVRHEDHCRRGI